MIQSILETPRIGKSAHIPKPTAYVHALLHEYNDWAFSEEQVVNFKGRWRSEVFKVDDKTPLDLEIGTGNGWYFSHHLAQNPERCLVGIEVKFKPLIQTIRRALKQGFQHGRVARYNANYLADIFGERELNNVIIHFPDPWEKKLKRKKNRVFKASFLEKMSVLQRSGARIEFKTDSEDYFRWALDAVKNSPYRLLTQTEDLHHSEWATLNFVTQFERYFLRDGLPIYHFVVENP